MVKKLVLCVPNFSEGRDREKVDRIAGAFKNRKRVYLLDIEMDKDHNRTVLTILGGLDEMREAVFEAVKTATELIDLRAHQGAHPRIGATDVVPFIPIQATGMDECIKLAREIGEKIGSELGIPVFLYEEAAIRPERKRLEEIRKGWLQSLSERIKEDPGWAPDFGPNMIHPTAGATVVGARKPLIAFNVNLDTPDIKIAKKIAWRIRESCGGLPHVKAIGLFLEDKGIVQVSMNLTDYESTPPDRVFRKIEEEARSFGVEIKDSEVIGLIPEKALLMASCDLLKLKGFREDQILEKRLATFISEMRGQSFTDLLSSISAPSPAPGGGAVSALAGSLGAALAAMACGLTKDKDLNREAEELKRLMEEFRRLSVEDEMAYKSFINAIKIPKGDPQRIPIMEESLKKASLIPLKVAENGLNLLSIIEKIIPNANKKTLPDLKVGILMAISAVEGAVEYVIVNTASLSEQTFIKSCKEKTAQIKASLNDYRDRFRAYFP